MGIVIIVSIAVSSVEVDVEVEVVAVVVVVVLVVVGLTSNSSYLQLIRRLLIVGMALEEGDEVSDNDDGNDIMIVMVMTTMMVKV